MLKDQSSSFMRWSWILDELLPVEDDVIRDFPHLSFSSQLISAPSFKWTPSSMFAKIELINERKWATEDALLLVMLQLYLPFKPQPHVYMSVYSFCCWRSFIFSLFIVAQCSWRSMAWISYRIVISLWSRMLSIVYPLKYVPFDFLQHQICSSWISKG